MFEQLYIDNEDEMMMMMKLIMLRFMKGKTSPLSLIAEQGNAYPLPNRIGSTLGPIMTIKTSKSREVVIWW